MLAFLLIINDTDLVLFCSAILFAPMNAFYMLMYTKDQNCCNIGPAEPAAI
jgi:hypothetical protein